MHFSHNYVCKKNSLTYSNNPPSPKVNYTTFQYRSLFPLEIISSTFMYGMCQNYIEMFMAITGIQLFHHNAGHLAKQLTVTCSWLSLVFISVIKILVICSNKLESHPHAYHWYSVISSKFWTSPQTTYSHMSMANHLHSFLSSKFWSSGQTT